MYKNVVICIGISQYLLWDQYLLRSDTHNSYERILSIIWENIGQKSSEFSIKNLQILSVIFKVLWEYFSISIHFIEKVRRSLQYKLIFYENLYWTSSHDFYLYIFTYFMWIYKDPLIAWKKIYWYPKRRSISLRDCHLHNKLNF